MNWEIDENSDHTLENWRQKLDLDLCTDIWKPSLIASTFFIGWALTLLWVPRLGDIYGRKQIFAVTMAFSVFLYAILMTTESLNVMILVSGLFGMLTSVRENIGFIYLVELFPKSY